MTGNAEGRSQFLYTKLCEGGLASQMPSLTVDDQKRPQFERKLNALEAILESLGPIITEEMKKEIISDSEFPHCPKCSSLLRPAVVGFGEPISKHV
jgi:hypothetical protein